MPSPQSCRTCRWRAFNPLWSNGAYYDCQAPYPIVPDAQRTTRNPVELQSGQSCPTWEARAPDTETDR